MKITTRLNGRRPGVLCAGVAVVVAVLLGDCSSHNTGGNNTTSTSSPSTTSTSSTSTTTSVPSSSSTTSSSTTSTTVATVANCQMGALKVKRGKISVAANAEVEAGFAVTNVGVTSCKLQGYPTLTLLSATGTVPSVVTKIGPTPPQLSLQPNAGAGFVLEYDAAGGITTCAESKSAHVVGIKVLFPQTSGHAVEAKVGFYMCPASAPTIKVTSLLSSAQYNEFLGVTGTSQSTTTTTS
jgi:hypothetical protein